MSTQDWPTYASAKARQEAEAMRQAALHASQKQHWFAEEPLPKCAARTMTPEALAVEMLAAIDRLERHVQQFNQRLAAVEDYLTKP